VPAPAHPQSHLFGVQYWGCKGRPWEGSARGALARPTLTMYGDDGRASPVKPLSSPSKNGSHGPRRQPAMTNLNIPSSIVYYHADVWTRFPVVPAVTSSREATEDASLGNCR
jgi:hypothetical protein